MELVCPATLESIIIADKTTVVMSLIFLMIEDPIHLLERLSKDSVDRFLQQTQTDPPITGQP